MSFWSKIKDTVTDAAETVKDFVNEQIRAPIMEMRIDNKYDKLKDVVNTDIINKEDFNKDSVNKLLTIYQDGKATQEEKQSLYDLPKIYQDIANSANTLQDVERYVYSDDYLNATAEEKQQKKSLFEENLQIFNDKYTKLKTIAPEYLKKQGATKDSQIDYFKQFQPDLVELEEITGVNTDLFNGINRAVQKKTADIGEMRGMIVEGGMENDKEIVDQFNQYKNEKTKEINKIILSGKNSRDEENYETFFDNKIKNDENFIGLSRSVSEMEDDIRLNMMKKSYNEAKAEKGLANIGTLYHGYEVMSSTVIDKLNDVAKKFMPVSAGDLSDIQYLSEQNGAVRNFIGGAVNRASRNSAELTLLAIPSPTKFIKGAKLVSKIGKTGDALKNAERLEKWINMGVKGVGAYEKFGPRLDAIFDYNFNPGMPEYITKGNVAFSVLPDLLFDGIGKGMKALKARNVRLVTQEALNGLSEYGKVEIPLSKLGEGAIDKYNIVERGGEKFAEVNITDFWDTMKTGQGNTNLIQALQDSAVVNVSEGKRLMDDAFNGFLDKIRTGSKADDNIAKEFIKNTVKSTMEGAGESLEQINRVMTALDNGMKTKKGIEEMLTKTKSAYKTTANSVIKKVIDMAETSKIMMDTSGMMPMENLEKMVNFKHELVKGVSDYFTGKNINLDDNTLNEVKGILKKINESGVMTDSDAMTIVKSFNKGYLNANASDYVTSLKGFIDNNLKYMPEGLKSTEQLKALSNAINTNFLEKLKQAGLSVDFKELGDGIGGTFTNNTAILSLLKDFYKDPKNFTIGLMHELTHGLINKKSSLYRNISDLYKKEITRINDKFSGLYKGFNIQNMKPEKLSDLGFSQEEIDYLRVLSGRYKNADEFMTYNLSETLLGNKVSNDVGSSFKILSSKLEGDYEAVYKGNQEALKNIDNIFVEASNEILNKKYQIAKLDKNIGNDLENFLYAKNSATKKSDDILKIGGMSRDKASAGNKLDALKNTGMGDIIKSMKSSRKDSAGLKILTDSEINLPEDVSDFIKRAYINGVFTGLKGNDAVIAGGMFEVLTDYPNIFGATDKLPKNITKPELMKIINARQTKLGAVLKGLNTLVPIAKGDAKTALQDMVSITDYYFHVDLLKQLNELPKEVTTGLKETVKKNISAIGSKNESALGKYGIKVDGRLPKKGLDWTLSRLINDLGSKVGKRNVDLMDYLFRTISSTELYSNKVQTLGIGLRSQLIDNMGLFNISKAQNPQDVINMFVEGGLNLNKDVHNSLFQLGKLFGIDENALLNVKAKEKFFENSINNGLLDGLSKYKKSKKYTPKTTDLLNFLNMSDFKLTTDNVDSIFVNIYKHFDKRFADEISTQALNIIKGDNGMPKQVKQIAETSLNEVRKIAEQEDKIFKSKLPEIESVGIKPKKVDIGELTPFAREDFYVDASGQVGSVRGESGFYREQDGKFIGVEGMNDRSINKGSYIKGYDGINEVVFESNYADIYHTLGLKKGNNQGLNQFMGKFINKAEFEKYNGLNKIVGLDKEFFDPYWIPTKIGDELDTEIKAYQEYYKKIGDNFGYDSEIAKYTNTKLKIGTLYRDARRTSEFANLNKAQSRIASGATSTINSTIKKLDNAVKKGDFEAGQKILDEFQGKFKKAQKLVEGTKTTKGIQSFMKEVEDGKILSFPGGKYVMRLGGRTVKNIDDLRELVSNMKMGYNTAYMENLRYTSMFQQGKGSAANMMDTIKGFAEVGFGKRNFKDILAENQKLYDGRYKYSENTINMIWDDIGKVEKYDDILNTGVSIQKGAVDNILDVYSKIIGLRYNIDPTEYKKSMEAKLVRAGIVEVKYQLPDGLLKTRYINVNGIDTLKNYKYVVNQSSIQNLDELVVELGDKSKHTSVIDPSSFSSIYAAETKAIEETLDINYLDTIREGLLENSERKDIMNITRLNAAGNFTSKLLSFTTTNLELIKEYAPDARTYVLDFNEMGTRLREYAGQVDGAIVANRRQIANFKDYFNANEAYLTACLLLDTQLETGKISVSQISEYFRNGGTIDGFVKDFGVGANRYNTIKEGISKSKKLGAKESFYAGVGYQLSKLGALAEYPGDMRKITGIIDDALDVYATNFQGIYKGFGEETSHGEIKALLQEYLMSSKSGDKKSLYNILAFNEDIVGDFKILEFVSENLKRPDNNIRTLKDLLSTAELSESVKKRIHEDLLGKSIYGDGTFSRLLATIKSNTYGLQLNRLSPKSWTIAGQNVVFNSAEQFSKRNIFGNSKAEIRSVFKDGMQDGEVAEIMMKYMGEGLDSMDDFSTMAQNATKQTDINVSGVLEQVLGKTYDYVNLGINKMTGKDVSKYKQSTISMAQSPLAVADTLTKSETMFRIAYNNAFDELGMTPKDMRLMFDELTEIKNQLKSATGREKEVLMQRKVSTLNRIENFTKAIKRNATFEYNRFFKMGQVQGLMRNGFSRWTMFNFFSSWGSKKMGEYVLNMAVVPYRKALMAGKLGGPSAFAKTFMTEVMTNQHMQSVIKSSLYTMKTMYELEKGNIELDKGEGDVGMFQKLLHFTPLGQAFTSFMITRSMGNAIEKYNLAKDNDLSSRQATLKGLSEMMYGVGSAFMKDIKFISSPLWTSMQDAYRDKDASFDDLAASFMNRIQFQLSTNIYYGAMDVYKSIESERVDADTMNPFLDAVLGDVITKYRGDMDRFMDDVYLKSQITEEGKLDINFVELASNSLLGLPQTYNRRYSLEKLKKTAENDPIYQAIKKNDISGVSDELKAKLFKELLTHTFDGEFDLSDNKGKIDGKAGLVLNELQAEGVDIEMLTKLINSGDLKGTEKELAILKSVSLTKASGIALLAYAAKQKYSQINKEFSKAGVSLSKNPEIKLEVERQLADTILPTANDLDKEFHSNMMFRYMQEAYGGTIPGLNEVKINEKGEISFGGGSDAESIKMFKLGLLAEVADLEAVNFNRDMLKTVGGRILADVSDEHVAKKTMEYFNMVDEMKSVSDNGKEIAKATVLYGNLNRMKILLNSKYAPGMVDEMDKLAEIIWKESGKIELNPELLDGLGNGSGYGKKGKGKGVKFKGPDFKFQKDVIDGIKDLKETAYNNPQLKPNLMRVAGKNTDAKLKQLNLPTIPKRDGQDYKPKELTPMKIKPIEPAEIEVKKAGPEIKKFKYKFAKDKPIKKKGITRAKTSGKTTRISKP